MFTTAHAHTSSEVPPPRKKFKDAAGHEYDRGWDVLYTRGDSNLERNPEDLGIWGRLYERWWGLTSAGGSSLSEELEKTPPAIQVGDGHNTPEIFELLIESKGWMIVRDEYQYIYDRLFRIIENGDSGVVLTGQPGIGKSYFAIYALLQRMREEKETLFTTATGMCYRFDETGIKVKKEADFKVTDLPTSNDPISRVWSIIDTPKTAGQSLVASRTLFVLITCSPKEDRYKEWMKQVGAVWWLMNPWSEEELLWLLSKPEYTKLSEDQRNRHGSPEGIRKLLYDVGPCPRDIVKSIRRPIAFNKDIKLALRKLHDVDTLIALFTTVDNQPDSISHKITLITRCEPKNRDSNPGSLDGDDDIGRVYFKSQKIRESAMKHFEFLSLQERKRFIEFTKSCPAGSQIAGWTFEGIANEYIRGSRDGWVMVFHPLVTMNAVKCTKATKKWPCRFQHHANDDPVHSELEVFGNGSVEARLTGSLEECDSCPSQHTTPMLPIRRRTAAIYDEVDSLRLDENSWYCPERRNNPLFDSFFFQIIDKSAVLWVFQMTVAKVYDGKVSGFEILRRLKEKMLKRHEIKGIAKLTSIEVNLVLVTPFVSGQVVKWNLPEEWKELNDPGKGQVYIQYVEFPPVVYPSPN